MTLSIIKIDDIDKDVGKISIDVTYEFTEEEKADIHRPLTNSTIYAYTINYLFRTKKIEAYVKEAMAELVSTPEDQIKEF